ncbi:hypothetical protein [Streptomyces sp. t39]|uniref:hypothetical protein n=1 Tax=Streptomyces sp. t39 TaxID=1828156 RepID=UPI00164F9B17|nr:hypothetical protein [Streptomyces sp. t39]
MEDVHDFVIDEYKLRWSQGEVDPPSAVFLLLSAKMTGRHIGVALCRAPLTEGTMK